MEKFLIDGRMTVKDLEDEFFDVFGCELRVYQNINSNRYVDDDVELCELSDIRSSKTYKIDPDTVTVGDFRKKLFDNLRLNVKVGTPDKFVLALDGLTLHEVSRLPKQTTRDFMQEIISLRSLDVKEVADALHNNRKKVFSLLDSKEKTIELVDYLDAFSEKQNKNRLIEFGEELFLKFKNVSIEQLLSAIKIISRYSIEVGLSVTQVETLRHVFDLTTMFKELRDVFRG